MSEPVPSKSSPFRWWLVGGLTLVAVVATAWWFTSKQPPLERSDERLTEILRQIETGSADRAALEEAVRISGSTPRFASFKPLFTAALHVANREYDAAILELNQREPGDSTREASMLVIGQALFGAGRPNEAARLFYEVIVLDPGNLLARFHMVRYWHERGSVSGAMSELERITQVAPDDYRAWRGLGGYAFDFSRYADTIKYLDQALRCAPPTEPRQEILLELGQSYFQQHDYDRAVETLAEARPSALGEAVRAESYEALGQADEADECLARAVKLDGKNRMVRLATARLALQRGRPTDAVEPLVAQLKETPNDRDCQFQLTLAYSALGQAELAEAERAKFAALDLLTDRFTELNTQATARPKDLALREELAEICEKLGQPRQAEAWRRAVAILRQELELSEIPK